MGICEVCGKYSNVNLVGICSSCWHEKPANNRFGEEINWGNYEERMDNLRERK